MRLGETQLFASPEEALTHYGVKGMKWGVRKEGTAGEVQYSKNVRTVYSNKILKNVETFRGRIDRVENGKASILDKYRVGPSVANARKKADAYEAHAIRVRDNKMTKLDKVRLIRGAKTDVLIDAAFDQTPNRKQSTPEKIIRHPVTKTAVKISTSVAISKATAPLVKPMQDAALKKILHSEDDPTFALGRNFVEQHLTPTQEAFE